MSGSKGFAEVCSAVLTARDTQNMRGFTGWLTATGLTFAAVTLLLDGKFVKGALGWTLVAVTVVLLIQTLRAYMKFIRNADELLRKIQLDGLAAAFAAGAVFMIGYRLSMRLGAKPLDIDDPLLVMLVAWVVGQWLGMRRYAFNEVEP